VGDKVVRISIAVAAHLLITAPVVHAIVVKP
jgi:hypothetical protein